MNVFVYFQHGGVWGAYRMVGGGVCVVPAKRSLRPAARPAAGGAPRRQGAVSERRRQWPGNFADVVSIDHAIF